MTSSSNSDVYYFLGNITSHVLHVLPLWKKLGGTIVVTSLEAKQKLEGYGIPVVCVDDVPLLWRWQGKRPRQQREYITLDTKFKRTSDYLNKRARVVIFYELFEFSRDIELVGPRKVFLTHGNMLKNYLKMYPHRLDIMKTYDYMAALGPFMKQEFLDSGVAAEKLVDIGIARTDEVVAISSNIVISDKLRATGIPSDKPVVSYLPTFWGDSSVERLGPLILERTSEEYTVLFRPHPQTPAKIVNRYLKLISKRPNLFYLPEAGPDQASLLDLYAASSLIIGDVSSVMLEAILLDKPLIFATPDTTSNVAPHRQIDEIISYSPSVSLENVNDVSDMISSALNRDIDRRLWKETKARCFYGYTGDSVRTIVTFIESLERT